MFKSFSIHSSLAIAAVILAGPAYSQPISTTAQSAALHCSTQAGSGAFSVLTWSVGATLSVPATGASGQEARAGAAQLGALNLTKAFDECSPALFQALVTAVRMPTFTITDRDRPDPGGREASHGSASPLTIQLQGVQISHYMVGDSGSAAGPSESISLVYERITITNTANGSKFCWDVAANRSCS